MLLSRLPPLKTKQHPRLGKEIHSSYEPDSRKAGSRPEQSAEEIRRSYIRSMLEKMLAIVG